MRTKSLLALVTSALLLSTGSAQAGCGKGAVAGGVIGHVAGKHGVAGAVVGCAVGHHAEKKKQKQQQQQQAAAAAAAQNNAAPASEGAKPRK